jgi:hypothetical protein
MNNDELDDKFTTKSVYDKLYIEPKSVHSTFVSQIGRKEENLSPLLSTSEQ